MSRAKGTGTIFKPKGSRFYWVAYISGGNDTSKVRSLNVSRTRKTCSLTASAMWGRASLSHRGWGARRSAMG